MGQALFGKGQYQQAISEYDQALALTPKNSTIIKARQEAALELTRNEVKKHSDEAIKMLGSGNSVAAKNEIRKMLTAIPNEPIVNSK